VTPPPPEAKKKVTKRRKPSGHGADATVGAAGDAGAAVGAGAEAEDDSAFRRRSSSFDLSKKVSRTQSMRTLANMTRAAPPEEGDGEVPVDADDDGPAVAQGTRRGALAAH